MIFNKKQKAEKPKPIKIEPKIGDFKRKVKFALFPVTIENKIVWLEKYIKVFRFEQWSGTYQEELSSGFLSDMVELTGLKSTRVRTKYYTATGWCYHSREFYRGDNGNL